MSDWWKMQPHYFMVYRRPDGSYHTGSRWLTRETCVKCAGLYPKMYMIKVVPKPGVRGL